MQDFNQIPRAYVVEPPQWGEKTYAPGEILSFHLVLAGRVLKQLPLILRAFHNAFQRGIGKGDGTASMVHIWHMEGVAAVPILESPCGHVATHKAAVPPAPTHAVSAVTLHFNALALVADGLASDKQLQWRDWTRYSSRQQQQMDLGGVIGRWKLTGDLAPFLHFLHLGQWLHVGKEAAFGLGGYRLEWHA